VYDAPPWAAPSGDDMNGKQRGSSM